MDFYKLYQMENNYNFYLNNYIINDSLHVYKLVDKYGHAFVLSRHYALICSIYICIYMFIYFIFVCVLPCEICKIVVFCIALKWNYLCIKGVLSYSVLPLKDKNNYIYFKSKFFLNYNNLST